MQKKAYWLVYKSFIKGRGCGLWVRPTPDRHRPPAPAKHDGKRDGKLTFLVTMLPCSSVNCSSLTCSPGRSSASSPCETRSNSSTHRLQGIVTRINTHMLTHGHTHTHTCTFCHEHTSIQYIIQERSQQTHDTQQHQSTQVTGDRHTDKHARAHTHTHTSWHTHTMSWTY